MKQVLLAGDKLILLKNRAKLPGVDLLAYMPFFMEGRRFLGLKPGLTCLFHPFFAKVSTVRSIINTLVAELENAVRCHGKDCSKVLSHFLFLFSFLTAL